jgi:hypothetical protein
MSKEAAIKRYSLRDSADCASTSFSALLPNDANRKTLAAVYNNAFNLEDVAAMISYEHLKNNILASSVRMPDGMKPSHFFRRIAHELRHGTSSANFIGGLMLLREEDERHLIAITNIHEGKSPGAKIVDTAAPEFDLPVIRKVPLDWLDRKVEPIIPYIIGTKAIAFVGRIIPEVDGLGNKDEESINLDLIHQGLLKHRSLLLQRSQQKEDYDPYKDFNPIPIIGEDSIDFRL